MEETIPYLYFVQHGHFCASRPLEVIAATVTTTIFLFHYLALITRKYASFHEGSIFTMWPKEFTARSANHSHETGSDQMHVALITLTRCLSLLYCYYQLQTVQRSFSKPVAGITSLFAIVSAVVFSAGLVNVLQLQVTELGDVIMFYLLWMDLSNVSQLVRMGVRTSDNFQLNSGIGNILGRLGPVMTFDSAIKILVISIGFISGVRQLEILAFLSLLAIVVNYIIFMTIFPASLSMIVEVTRKKPKATVSKSVSFTPATLSSCNLHSPPTQLQTQATSNSSSQNLLQQSYSQSKIPGVVQTPQPSSQSLNGILSSTSTLPAIITTGARTQPSNHNYHQLLQQQPPFPDTANYNNKLLVQVLKLVIGATFLLQQSYGYWRFPVDPSNVDFTTNTDRATASSGEKMLSVNNGTDEASQLSDAYSLIISVFFLRVDQIVILSLILVLSLKYIFYDSKVEPSPPVAEDSSSNTSAPKEAAPVQRVLPLPVLNKKSQMNHLSRSASLTEEEAMELLSRPNPVKKTDSLPVHISFTVGESESDSDLEGSRKTSVVLDSKGIQTLESFIRQDNAETNNDTSAVRSLQECIRIYNSQEEGAQCLTDAEVVSLVDAKTIPAYQLEKAVQDEERGVVIRRKLIGRSSPSANNAFNEIPFKHYDYSKITGACCENVVGYIPVPVGVVGPLNLDGKMYHVPMATTEGCLVASTNRGCRALSNGVNCRVVADGMTRGPVVRFPSAVRASEASIWLSYQENFEKLKESFDGSSRFARLQKITCRCAGRYLFIRFVAKTGDAMGMNMISKGTEISLKTLQTYFCDMEILSLSGNFCTDKKPAAVNWIEGRGKSVVAEAVVPAHIVHNVLKTSAAALVELNIAKNLVGSAMAGSIGGYNAHAANIVAAIFIATGQDTAQCVGSSNCITLMETWGLDNQDLYISCTMPSIEVGTVGGGTCLPAQTACLSMLGVQGPHSEEPGENARALARVVCATVLAGELSLMSALAAGHLVRSHLKHNRSSANVDATTTMRMVATSPAAFPTSTSLTLHPPSLSPNSGAPSELIPKILTSNHHNNNWNSSSISTLRLNDSSKNIESNKMDYESRLATTTTTTTTTDRGNNNKFEAENFCAQTHYSTSTIKVPSSVPVPETSAVITNNCIQLTSTSASLSSAVPPKSMDLLSVPTECKQF